MNEEGTDNGLQGRVGEQATGSGGQDAVDQKAAENGEQLVQNTAHHPSKFQAVVFFVFSLLVAAGVIVWVFFFNKGTLVLSGDFPFQASTGSNSITCTASPCSLKLKPDTYGITFSKEGFQNDIQKIEVKRGGVIEATPNFAFIPVIKEVGELILPFVDAPLSSPFLGVKKIENIPTNAKAVLFSQSGDRALVFLGREVYLYSTADKSLDTLPFLASSQPVWAGDSIVFLEREDAPQGVNRASGEAKDIVKIFDGKNSQPVVIFDRPFRSPRLSGGAKTLLIEDKTELGRNIFYIVDIEKKTRKRLPISELASFHRWISNYMLFEEFSEKAKYVFLIELEFLKEIPIPAIDADNVTAGLDGHIFFLTLQKKDSDQPKIGLEISEVIEEAERETKSIAAPQKETTYYITDYGVTENSFKTITTLSVGEGEKIERLTYDKKENKLYFLKNGRLFEVLLNS